MSPITILEDGSVEFHVIDLHGNLVRLGGAPSQVSERVPKVSPDRTPPDVGP